MPYLDDLERFPQRTLNEYSLSQLLCVAFFRLIHCTFLPLLNRIEWRPSYCRPSFN